MSSHVGQPSRLKLRERGSRAVLLGVARIHKMLGMLPLSPRPDLIEARILTGDLRGKYLAVRGTQVGGSMVLGTFEGWVARAMDRYVRPGSVAYDIGASYGYHTLRLSSLVGNHGSVIAFEPNPTDRDILTRNIEANRIENVMVKPIAVGNENRILKFATFSYPGISHILRDDTPKDAVVIEVQSMKLDDLVVNEGNPAPNFIKIDVEGGELDVLFGARCVLEQAKPVVVCEVRKGNLWREVMKFMGEHGYLTQVLHESASLGDVLFLPIV